MKKLLTVLCVAACGIGAAAQAQIEVNPSVSHIDRQVVRKTAIETPVMSTFETPKFTQAGVVLDTLYQPGEYDPQNPDCGRYIYCLRWGNADGYFEEESDVHGYGSNMNGTGEIGVTFETAGNIYFNYSGHNMNEWVVVGALAYAYRQGGYTGWARHDISRFGDHVTDIKGNEVPDLPYKLAGYYVEEQDAIEDYLTEDDEYSIVSVKMPLTIADRAETEVGYLPILEPADNNGKPFPDVQRYGGMFKDGKAIRGGNDFGLSFHAQLTGDATYDSLWNFALATRSSARCVLMNNWITWQRVDYSNPEGWNALGYQDGSELNAAAPIEERGLTPEGCPQHDNGKSLFVTWASQLFRTGQEIFYPCIYAIIQESKVANEAQDAYAQTISVYPMPATDKVNMVSVDPMQRIEIYNMAGSLLKHVTLNESVAEMDVTGMAPGTYIARIVTEKGVAAKKLLVK